MIREPGAAMILEPTTEIFIGRGEERKGSFKLAEVRRKLANGTLLPTDLYWSEGMEEWQPLRSLPPEPPPLPERSSEEEDNNPYRPPLAETSPGSPPIRQPGIGRLVYVLLFALVTLGQALVIEHFQLKLESFRDRLIVVSFLLPIIAFRLKNIGFHPLNCLIALVPLLNVIVLLPCLFCQAGYAISRKLDKPGRIAMVVFFVVFVIAVLSALLIPVSVP